MSDITDELWKELKAHPWHTIWVIFKVILALGFGLGIIALSALL